jgi:hypothetical protein
VMMLPDTGIATLCMWVSIGSGQPSGHAATVELLSQNVNSDDPPHAIFPTAGPLKHPSAEYPPAKITHTTLPAHPPNRHPTGQGRVRAIKSAASASHCHHEHALDGTYKNTRWHQARLRWSYRGGPMWTSTFPSTFPAAQRAILPIVVASTL